MNYLSILLAACAGIIVIVGFIWLFRLGFHESVWWGLGMMFLPLLIIVFLVYKWPLGRGPLVTAGMGGFMFLLFYPSAINQLEEKPLFHTASVISLSSPGEWKLTAEGLEKRRLALLAKEEELRQRRESLNTRDANAVRRLAIAIEDYNRELQDYQRQADEFAARDTTPTLPEIAPAQ